MTEQTLSIIKPDAVERNLSEKINTLEPKTVTFDSKTKFEKFISENSLQLKPMLLLILIIFN